jgi:RND superfamily putative drug exporter
MCLLWIGAAIALLPVGSTIDKETKNDTESLLPSGSESGAVSRLLKARFASGETAPALLVYRSRDDEPLTADQRRAITTVARAAAGVPRVYRPGVRAPFGPGAARGLVSADGRTAFTVVPIRLEDRKQVPDTIAELRDLGSGPQIAQLEYHVTGPAALEADFASSLESGDVTLLAVSIMLVLGLLLAIYRSPVLAVVPIVVVLVAYLIAIGVLTLLARGPGLRVDSTATSLLLVLMFGAGTDYCLLFVSRYSQALRRHARPLDAVIEALPQTAPAIVASGVTVALALLVMVAADLRTTQILGPVNAIGVLIALAASLTLLPAILALLGRRAFWPRHERVAYQPGLEGAAAEDAGTRDSRWGRVGRRVVAQPRRVLAISVTGLAVCCLGLLAYDGMTNPVDLLRSDQDSVQGFDVLDANFPGGLLAPTTIVVERGDGPLAPADLGVVRAAIRGVRGSTEVPDSEERSRDGRLASVSVFFDDDPYGDAAFDRIDRMRAALTDLGRPGVTALVGDSTAQQVDYGDGAQRDNLVLIPLALLVIAAVLVVLLRALLAPLYLIATVVLSFGATLGISILFFAEVLGQEQIDPAIPTFAFIFLVALGVDYNIFLMSRVREEALVHGTQAGLLRALVDTGPVITSAGLVLAATFSVLMTIPVVFLFQVGFAVALGVLIDTFIVRTLVVPAITSMLGERTWWPSQLHPTAAGPPDRGGAGGGGRRRKQRSAPATAPAKVPLSEQWRAQGLSQRPDRPERPERQR